MTSTTSSVPIIDDPKDEIDEDLTITLSNPTGSGDALIADGTGIVTINDNDAPPLASVPATFTVPEPGDNTTDTADVPVTLSEISDFQVTVNYSTTDVEANSPEDYVAASGSTIIPPGSSSANIPITINGQPPGVLEGEETFGVMLTGATNATVDASNDTTVVSISRALES